MNSPENPVERPNIVLIMVESWDGRVLSLWDDPALKNITPNLARFAEKGVAFKYNYTSQPICCPARANLWSGQYTYHCKSWNNHKGLASGTPILRDILTQKGYILAAGKSKKNDIGIGKHDYREGGHSQQNRITAWTGAANIELPSYLQAKPKIHKIQKKPHMNDWQRVKKAKEFITSQKQNQNEAKEREESPDPFFLYLSLTTPHPRFHTSKKYLKQVDIKKVSIPPKDTKIHPTIRYQQINKDWRWGFDAESVRKTRSIYYGMVAETDDFIGDFLNKMEELNLFENTYVIITADHGENNMEHELFYKMNMYESSVNTPLLIRGPDIQQGIISKNIVSLVDLYPTILDMAYIPLDQAPNEFDGESILPLLQGKTVDTRNWAFSMYTGTACNTSLWMLRKENWKYIAYPGYSSQLFDLEKDPDEIHDLSEEHPELVARLDAELNKIVDYQKMHTEWQIYCKQAFRNYREYVQTHPIPLFEYGAAKLHASYEEVMANTYKGWTEKHAVQLEAWLEQEPK